MLIIKNDTDKRKCMSAFGDNEFVLTKEEVLALHFDEYGTFITMKKEE